jgi:hypothetical protein
MSLEGGATPEKTKAAAEEVASVDSRMQTLEGMLRLHTWILTATFGLVLSLAVKAWLCA